MKKFRNEIANAEIYSRLDPSLNADPNSFLRRRFISTKQIYKKSYIQYQTHYIQKKRNKGKKETRNIKRGKKKKWG